MTPTGCLEYRRGSVGGPRQDKRRHGQDSQNIRGKAYSPELPITALSPLIQPHKPGIHERGRKRAEQHRAKTENADISQPVQPNGTGYQIASGAGANQRLAAVAE